MRLDEFEATLQAALPPDGIGAPLAALWWLRRGDWARAHALVQDEPGPDAAHVHALLHRIEGDLGNAGYWYRRAGAQVGQGNTENEWRAIACRLLGERP
jgi:hypothetical protein